MAGLRPMAPSRIKGLEDAERISNRSVPPRPVDISNPVKVNSSGENPQNIRYRIIPSAKPHDEFFGANPQGLARLPSHRTLWHWGLVRQFFSAIPLAYFLTMGGCGRPQKMGPVSRPAANPFAKAQPEQPAPPPRPEPEAPTTQDPSTRYSLGAEEVAPEGVFPGSAKPLASDVTWQELDQLRQDPDIKRIWVIFHADWCVPCKVIETPEYQKRIKQFNKLHPGTRIVTLDTGEPTQWPEEMKSDIVEFLKVTVGVETLPSVLYLNNKNSVSYVDSLTDEAGKDPFHLKKDFDARRLKSKEAKKLPATLSSPTTQPTPVKVESEQPPAVRNLASEVTINEFFQLRQDPKIKFIILSFHAPWCKPCQYLKTKEYQDMIKKIHKKHPEIRIVTMDIEAQSKSEMEHFKKMVVYEKVKSGDREHDAIVIPKTLYIRNKDGRYFKRLGSKPSDTHNKDWKKVLNPKAFDDMTLPVLPKNLGETTP